MANVTVSVFIFSTLQTIFMIFCKLQLRDLILCQTWLNLFLNLFILLWLQYRALTIFPITITSIILAFLTKYMPITYSCATICFPAQLTLIYDSIFLFWMIKTQILLNLAKYSWGEPWSLE